MVPQLCAGHGVGGLRLLRSKLRTCNLKTYHTIVNAFEKCRCGATGTFKFEGLSNASISLARGGAIYNTSGEFNRLKQN
jgi:hypothetical protein